ncbi:MAG: HEAT repeat domain-containing protein, partial [Candidatus Eisenbacteria bacterium]|nr:HEAT repeat domain-containing protein [Candidatus Eisenbacteria bacterium]
ALRFLQARPESVSEGIAAALADREPPVRRAAVEALGSLRARDQLAALCHALRDSDLQVSTAAIEALVAIGDPGAVRHLIEVLKDESEYARRAAVEVLNEVATPEAIADLVHALQDEDWWVRVRAADALGALGGDRVVDAILGLVHSEDVFVRRYAIEILNSIPNEKSVPALLESLHDADWWVRERSIDALGKTRDPRCVAPLVTMLRADPQVAGLVLAAMGKIGSHAALEVLVRASQSEDESVRDIGRKELRQLARQSSDAEVRKGAARALSELGGASEWGRSQGQTEPVATGSTSSSVAIPISQLSSQPQPVRSPSVVLPTSGNMAAPASGAPAPDSVGPMPESTSGASGASRSGLPAPVGGAAANGAAPASGAGSPGVWTSFSFQHFPNLPPDTILLDRYRIVRKIGEGGFGYVYLVLDGSVGEEIILKILSPKISLDESMIRRFVHELKYNRRIIHPNVIRLYDFLELNPGHAISMEYFPSEDLGLLLERGGKIAPEQLLPLAAQICEGLRAAHDSGIVHRDIKPHNVLIGEHGRVKIVDFGLAASEANQSRVTRSGIIVGTPQYMAPEQIRGGEVDHRTDLYALGAMLFECLTGAPPYRAENPVAVLMMHLTDPVPPVREQVADAPDALVWLIETALAKDPAERPQSAGEILAEIERRAA